MNKIIIITVNYRNAKPTKSFIQSIEKCDHNNFLQIIIVDNDTTSNSFNILKEIQNSSLIKINLIRSNENRFYWGGVSYALENFGINENKHFDWVIVCNNDVEFYEQSFFSTLLQLNPNDYPIIAPKINSSLSGKNLNPFLTHPISRIQDTYYRLYYSNSITAKSVHKVGQLANKIKKSMTHHPPTLNSHIYAPHGACIIFSKDFFSKGGYLETGFTMYGEEISTAEIAKKLDLSIQYIPSLILKHNDHQSMSESSYKENFLHSKETYYYLKRKYRS